MTFINELLPITTPNITLPQNFFSLGYEKERYPSWTYAYDSVATIGLAACLSTLNFTVMDSLVFDGTSGHVQYTPDGDRAIDTISFISKLKTLHVHERN